MVPRPTLGAVKPLKFLIDNFKTDCFFPDISTHMTAFELGLKMAIS